jgi:hypothetical protein
VTQASRRVRDPIPRSVTPAHPESQCRQTGPTRRPSSNRANTLVTLPPSVPSESGCNGRQAVHVSLDLRIICSSSRVLRKATFHRIHKLGVPMTRHMIWAEDENFSGWCCSRCPWGVVAQRGEHRRRARLQSRGRRASSNTPAHTTSNERRGPRHPLGGRFKRSANGSASSFRRRPPAPLPPWPTHSGCRLSP